MSFSKRMQFKYQKYKIDINEYKMIEKISAGAFGSVFLVQNIKTKDKYAAKLLTTNKMELNYQTMVNREIAIMILCNHPTIVKFQGYSLKDFNNENNAIIFMEYAKRGSLANLLQKSRKGLSDHDLDNTSRQKILIGIARGMMYLHQHQIIHRDLKPGNVLLDENLEPHITDFGLSKKYEIGQTYNQSRSCGTSIYMAPEVISSHQYTQKADVYSFGILMFEVVTDLYPYPELEDGEMTAFKLYEQVVHHNYRPKFKYPVKKSIRNLIERCWDKDTKKRPTFEELFDLLSSNKHEFFYDVFSDEIDCKDDEDGDDNKYYLDDVDDDQVQLYVDDIINDYQIQINDDKKEQKINELEKLIKKIQNKNKKMKEELLIAKEKNTNLFDENKKIKSENIKFKKQINTIKNENYEIKSANSKLMNQINSIKNENDEFKSTNTNLIKQINAIKNENYEIKSANSKLMNQINAIKNENDEFKSTNANLIKHINTIKNENDEIKSANSNYIKQITDIQNKYEIIKSYNSNLENQISEIKKENNEIKSDNSNLLLQIAEIQKNINELNVCNDSKNVSIAVFNKFPLKSQKFITSDIISKPVSFISKFLRTPTFLKLNKLLDYIMKISDTTENCIKIIHPNTETKLIELNDNAPYLNSISICSNLTKILFMDKKLSNANFIEIIKQFEEVFFEINHPSNIYSQIQQTLMNLRKKGFQMIKITVITNDESFNIKNNQEIDGIVIGSSLTSIKQSAFYECLSLQNVSFENPSSLKKIEKSAFYFCSSLKQISIPSSVISIGDHSFYWCSSITQISIPSSVTEIGEYAFSGCSSITQITIPSSVTEIGEYAFNGCSSLAQISFYSSITSIKKYTFNGCSSLTQITIPSNVTSIGSYAFSGCSLLEEISIPPSVTLISDCAFNFCISLKQISIPSSVTLIGENAFSYCHSLKHVSIPSSFQDKLLNLFPNTSINFVLI